MQRKIHFLFPSASCEATWMVSASLFVEDFGQEEFLIALAQRLAREQDVELEIWARSVRGGYGKALTELSEYVNDLMRGREPLPDFLIVARDANCQGRVACLKEVGRVVSKIEEVRPGFVVTAIPDPHVERWMLVDSQAFKAVLGRGCKAPDQKCEKQRYKKQLLEAMRDAGVVPPLGGMEFAQDLVEKLDLKRAASLDDSLGLAVADLRRKLGSFI
jgi:hypothetical protein